MIFAVMMASVDGDSSDTSTGSCSEDEVESSQSSPRGLAIARSYGTCETTGGQAPVLPSSDERKPGMRAKLKCSGKVRPCHTGVHRIAAHGAAHMQLDAGDRIAVPQRSFGLVSPLTRIL